MLKIAFMGFRHGHILSLYSQVKANNDFRIVAACEEDPAARTAVRQSGSAEITHEAFSDMLDRVDCDIVAVGDYYAKRGSILIEAMRRGKHVISDKPICTRLEELDQIEELARSGALKVGCQFDTRENGTFLRMRELVRGDAIGEVHAIAFGGQHPLLLGSRPGWYFEPGMHGGTINDIAIHAFDSIPWMTGLSFAEIVAARTWNAFAPQFPHFRDAAQFMLTMHNGCGVMGDVSYFMPDSHGYRLSQYWRTTLFGRKGVLETSCTADAVMLAQDGKASIDMYPPCRGTAGSNLASFAREIAGETSGLTLSTREVLSASRTALKVQRAAEKGLARVTLAHGAA